MSTVRFGADGRVLVPIELRREAGIVPGEAMVARVEGDRLVIERQEATVHRIQERFAVVPRDVSLVEDLIADRLREIESEPA